MNGITDELAEDISSIQDDVSAIQDSLSAYIPYPTYNPDPDFKEWELDIAPQVDGLSANQHVWLGSFVESTGAITTYLGLG